MLNERGRTGVFGAWKAWGLLAGTLMFLAAGIVVYRTMAPSVDAVALQVAGSAQRANAVVGQRAHDFRVALGWDFALIAGYTLGLAGACYLGRKIFWTNLLRTAAAAGLGLAVAAGALNAVQDVLLLVSLRRVPMTGTWIFRIVQALSFAKFSTLLVATVVAVCAWATALGRLWSASRVRSRMANLSNADLIAPPTLEPTSRSDPSPASDAPVVADPAGHWKADNTVPFERRPAHIGVCVSGGGVRSASVALGALQALREKGQLLRARYLLSVSGGGYMAGAFQLALTSGTGENQMTDAKPEDVFAPGSVEEDHTRRHSDYLSDGPREWLVALGVILRGVVSSLLVIGLVVAFVGIVVGRFYRATRIADLTTLRPFLASGGTRPKTGPGFVVPTAGVSLAIAVAVAVAVLAYLLRVFWESSTGHSAGALTRASKVGAATALLFALVGAALPAVVWTSVWLTWHLGWHTTPGTVASTGAVTGGLMYAGTLAATLWRKRKTLTAGVSGVLKTSKKLTWQVVPNSMVQMLLLWIALLVVFAALVLVSGWVAASGVDRSPWAFAPLGGLVLGAVLFDQTAMSMHPFYRRRLATAFSVRRGHFPDGRSVAVPYDYETEGTSLSQYAKPITARDERSAPEDRRFPKVIFCAAANLTRQDVTPPGRRTVSYTLANDWVGGPQVGWVRTEALERLVGVGSLSRDLTVQAAVAISGAAFASAMGSQTRFYEVFLALSNARLGAWLPNPGFLARKHANLDDWTIPGLPGLRRLSYFAREILGLHPSTSRLLLCTDGGHYDNLGLVEMLRHRCHLIYVIDATGDSPPLATTLAQAIALAREELGVKITLRRDPLDLVPGGAEKLKPEDPLAPLNVRLSKGLVITGDITYPSPVTYEPDADFPGFTADTGTLVVAKTGLTPDLPYELLSYALEDPAYPRDGTADQWFDCGQFDAYQGLGQGLGERAYAAAREAKAIDDHGRPTPPGN